MSTIRSLGVFFLFSLTIMGCGNEGSRQTSFHAEKLFHDAEKAYEKATLQPNITNTEVWAAVRQKYLEAVNFSFKNLGDLPHDRYPDEHEDIESIAYLAANRLASIYYAEKTFDSSISVLRRLMSLTDLSGAALLNSRRNLARSLQAAGDWDAAREIKQSLIDTFYPPVDNNNEIIDYVIELPLELVENNRLAGNEKGLADSRLSAEDYYRRLINEWPGTRLERIARFDLSRLYADEGVWQRAIDNLALVKDSLGQLHLEAALMMAEYQINGTKKINAALDIYRELLTRDYDSAMTANIYIRMGKAYFNSGQYKKCLETMNKIKKDYYQIYISDPTVQLYIALCYEREGDWQRAESELVWLTTNFPKSEEAFDAYLIIVEYYDREGDQRLKDSWIQKAKDFYTEMARKYSGTNIEISAISYLAEVARREKKWKAAVDYLAEIFNKYPEKEASRQALYNAAMVYRNELGDTAMADSLMVRLKSGI